MHRDLLARLRLAKSRDNAMRKELKELKADNANLMAAVKVHLSR